MGAQERRRIVVFLDQTFNSGNELLPGALGVIVLAQKLDCARANHGSCDQGGEHLVEMPVRDMPDGLLTRHILRSFQTLWCELVGPGEDEHERK